MITADHAILNNDDVSREGDQVVLVIQDQFTKWLQAYPSASKNTHETLMAFQKFSGPGTRAKHCYTDNSAEFKRALDRLEIDHDTSTPNRSESNGVAERAVRRVKEGTTCALVQSGLSDKWWQHAVRCFLPRRW